MSEPAIRMRTIVRDNLSIELPADAGVTAMSDSDGKLLLNFTSFTGSIAVQACTQRGDAKRARTDDPERTPMESDGADPAASNTALRTELAPAGQVFRNGGGLSLSDDEDDMLGAPEPRNISWEVAVGDDGADAAWDAVARGSPGGARASPGSTSGSGPVACPVAAAAASAADSPGKSEASGGAETSPSGEVGSPAGEPAQCAFPFERSHALERWEWVPVRPSGDEPSPRWAHSAVALGGKMYASRSRLTYDLEVY